MLQLTDVLPKITDFRHQLHRIPEIAGKERLTAQAIREHLAGLDLEVLPPFIGTDTVAILHGARPGKNLTLRADIDALSIKEGTGLPYASIHPGMMHACGHDGHSAILMGAAEILASHREEIKGTIRFVWQPGEENKAMARDLISAGAIDDPPPDMVAALHIAPGLPVGTIALREGAMMSSCCHFKVTMTGRGGHGSRPDLARNPLTAAAFAIVELQSVVSNRLNPQRAGVISVCQIVAGTLDNIIPDSASFLGTIRALDADTAKLLEESLREVCEGAAKIHRVDCDVNARQGYLPVINTKAETQMALKVIDRLKLPLHIYPESSMGSEDFSFFLTKAPGVLVQLGNGEDSAGLHRSDFSFNDAALENGIAFFVGLALEFSATRS